MVAIESIGGPTAPRIGTRTRAPTSSGFVLPGTTPSAAGASSAAAAAPATLGSMLTLQELGGEAVADREARRHGQDLLAALAELQRALLRGGDDASALQRLAELAATVPLAGDRRLAAMVSAIVVRAKVELARRQL